MAFDAFISYSHQDKPSADAACASLEAEGIRCSIAPRDIVGGTTWPKAINDAIENARMTVLIFSGHANTSQQVECLLQALRKSRWKSFGSGLAARKELSRPADYKNALTTDLRC